MKVYPMLCNSCSPYAPMCPACGRNGSAGKDLIITSVAAVSRGGTTAFTTTDKARAASSLALDIASWPWRGELGRTRMNVVAGISAVLQLASLLTDFRAYLLGVSIMLPYWVRLGNAAAKFLGGKLKEGYEQRLHALAARRAFPDIENVG